MATLTIPAKFKVVTEGYYEDYLAFLSANCCQKCEQVADLTRNHETNLWVCSDCNAELAAAIEAEAEAAELAEAAATMPAGREFVAGAGCQNCGAGGRLFEISETLESFMVCDACAGEFEPAAAPAIARKLPAGVVRRCCNCAAPARYDSIYCGDACRRAFLTFDYSEVA
jgi:uncharacterized protein with PIN domain